MSITQVPRRTIDMRTVVIVATLAIVSLLFVLPFVWTLSTSFRSQADLDANPLSLLPTQFTLENYVNIWQKIPFGRQLLNSIVFAGGVTVISVFLDSMAGYAFARYEFRGKNALFVVVLVTLMVPLQVTFIPLYSVLVNLGWINTFHGLIIPRIADAFGIFFFRQFFIGLPKDLEDAARIDGAREFSIYRRIMLPLAGPAVLTITLFNLIANWNDLLWPLMITTSSDMQTLPAGLALFRGQHVSDYGLLMAGSVLALLPMVVAFFIVQRRFIEGIATSGLK
jgi:multiple sugar transport system permease protein